MLFFKLIWEPFEAQFSSIEAHFSDHTISVMRLAIVDYQTRALDFQRRQGENFITVFNFLIYKPLY